MTITNFPMVSQRTTVTSDGKPSENSLFDCVPASIGAVMLWLEGKSAWNDTINPDKLKDAAYGETYSNAGTDAARYIDICKSMGFVLSNIVMTTPAYTVATAHKLLAENRPAIFTELDPYVDTNLPQYSGWTHVCVWFAGDGTGLTAMDPFIAQPVYKSDGTWANLLRANQVWTVERIPMSTVPAGWTDDGHTLRSPNNVPIVLGFRDYVLAHNWHPDNWALAPEAGMAKLEASNSALGGGDQQPFRTTLLGYTPERGVFEEWGIVELQYTRQQYSAIFADRQLKIQQIAQLQAEIDQLKAQPTSQPVPDPRVETYANKLATAHALFQQGVTVTAIP